MGISCHHLSYKYPNAPGDVFCDLSLEIETPGFHALFGPSGVGKTTFARMITGAVKSHAGKIAFSGIKRMAYTYNTERLPGWSTVGKHLKKVIPGAWSAQREALIEAFGVETCMDQRFGQLSMGQRNRVNLIRYLLQDFQLLILDESLANVDEPTRQEIILKTKAMFPDVYFLYISHNVVEVARFCRNIYVLRGPGKSPSMLRIQGRDMRAGVEPDKDRFERTMLEIMNAA